MNKHALPETLSALLLKCLLHEFLSLSFLFWRTMDSKYNYVVIKYFISQAVFIFNPTSRKYPFSCATSLSVPIGERNFQAQVIVK